MQNIFIIISIVFGLTSIILLFVLNSYSKKSKKNSEEKQQSDVFISEVKNQTTNWQQEKKTLIAEKLKAEEKNKKLWHMSETVHKERKLVDEANEKLSVEKEKLEADKKKLDEKVKKLWAQSMSIHKEKDRINLLKIEIEHKHQEIVDSVNYAKRIQRALLASEKLLQNNLPDYFILFKPKDIVSGDFYWASSLSNGSFAFVTADSTGHGVPGAIMSILNISSLNEAISAKSLLAPNEILDETRRRIMEHMANDGSAEGGKDGMDAVICNFNFQQNKLEFAAANNPLWLYRGEEIIEYKADKMPIGKPMGELKPFSKQEIELQKNDLIITLTDGFPDQFGGEKGKKFMYKPLKELIFANKQKPLIEIKQILHDTFVNWLGTEEQVDDVLIVGVRVK